MQSQNSEVIIRRAVFSDRWEVYQRTLFKVDVSLVYYASIFAILVSFMGNRLSLLVYAMTSPDTSLFPIGLTIPFAYLLLISALMWIAFNRYRLSRVCSWSNTWIAETNNQMVAVVCIQQEEGYSIVRCLRVDVSYRRRGIGTQLLRTVVEQIPENLYLKLKSDSYMLEFYDRLGFRRASFWEVPLQLKPTFYLGFLLVRS